MKRFAKLLISAALLFSFAASAAIVEEVIDLPVKVKGKWEKVEQTIKVTVWRDDAITTPQPLVIINHGRDSFNLKIGRARYPKQSKYFLQRGFAVAVPTRVGYGESGGADLEDAGSQCSGRWYEEAFDAAASQNQQIVEHMQKQTFIDPKRAIVIGVSYGGTTAIAAAGRNIPGVVAAINFSGGAGGDPQRRPGNPCRADTLEDAFAQYGKTSKVPTLWLYSINDNFWGEKLPKEWFEAFTKKGGVGEFVQLPPVGNEGHAAFGKAQEVWAPELDKFLASLSL